MKYKGRDFFVWKAVEGGEFEVIACSTDCSLEVSQELREVAPAASARAREFVPGAYDWSVKSEALIEASRAGFNSSMSFVEGIIQGAKVFVSFGVGTPNDQEYAGYKGYAFVQGVTQGAPLGSAATLSVQFKGTGPLEPIPL